MMSGGIPMPRGEPRTEQRVIRCTPAEAEIIDQVAAKTGRSMSGFVRWVSAEMAERLGIICDDGADADEGQQQQD